MSDLAGSMTIRFATSDDADIIYAALVGIADTVGARDKLLSTPDDLKRYGFGSTPAFNTLIAEVDEKFAGCCIYFSSFSTWMGKPGAYVQDFFVEETFRGFGIGETLLQHLAAVVRSQGGRYVRLSVDEGNARAKAFYTRCGLRHSKDEHVHMARDDAFDRLADAGSGTIRTEI